MLKPSGDFEEDFRRLTEPFIGDEKLYSKKSGMTTSRDADKGFLIVGSESGDKLYDGTLWDHDDIETISNMDYMYCLSSWDWWINPEFPSGDYRGNSYSVVFADDYSINEREIKSALSKEGYEVVAERKLYENNSVETYNVYDYHRVLQPLKLAMRINSIEKDLEAIKPENADFILRGGYLLSELVDYKHGSKRIMDPRSDYELDGAYIIDESIVTTRNLGKLGMCRESEFTMAAIDAPIPKVFYEDKHQNARFELPSKYLNVFASRIVEKNPMLIGCDYKGENSIVEYDSRVRNNFKNEIRNLKKLQDLDKRIEDLAEQLIER